jgi:hypothetical protein
MAFSLRKLFLADNRDKTYYHLIDVLPYWAIVIIFCVFVVVVTVFILIGALAGPQPNTTIDHEHNVPRPIDVFYGNRSLVTEHPKVSATNQEFRVFLVLKNAMYSPTPRETTFGWTKRDLRLRLKLEARNSPQDEWKNLTPKFETTEHILRVQCSQFSSHCSPVMLFYVDWIGYNYYRSTVTLLNAAELYDRKLALDYFNIRFSTINGAFTNFEIGFRIFFVIISIAFFVLFTWVVFRKQQLKRWHTEQLWMVPMLILLVLYNNPIFWIDIVAGSWFWPLLNIIFITTFISYLMLMLLITSHAAIKDPKDRSFIWFYLPKLVLVGAFWLFAIIVLTWIRIQDDPSFYVDSTAFITLGIVVIILILLYFLKLVYIFFRYLEKARHLPATYNARARAVWIFSLFVIIATAVDVLLFVLRRSWNNAAQFLSYFAIYNCYVYALGILYFPSTKVDDHSSSIGIELSEKPGERKEESQQGLLVQDSYDQFHEMEEEL